MPHAHRKSAGPGLVNPYDNAQAEVVWSTLKTELLLHDDAFVSLQQARLEMAYYLDTYFSLDRCYFALGYRSMHRFERDCLSTLSVFTGPPQSPYS